MKLRVFLISLYALVFSSVVMAQTLSDLSNLDINGMSNDQISLLLSRAQAMGYSQSDLFDLAKQQGLSLADISRLGQRINQIDAARVAQGQNTPIEDSRMQKAFSDSLRNLSERETDIFGLGFFRKNSQFLTFNPSLTKAPPSDYVLAAGDELFIDIYGQSEQYYQAEVNPEGTVVLEGVGPVGLAGLTITQAKSKLRTKLGTLYTGLKSADSGTYLNLSLGKLRTIQISIVGEVELPGTYTMSAFTTVFNSLYVSGGISENGTLRDIKLVRDGKPIASIDVYDFLLNGNGEGNLSMRDEDVLIVGPYTNRVTLNGAVKTPGRYELKEGETVSDLLKYAGGFNENAFTSQISVNRVQGKERFVADVFNNQYDIFTPKAGDIYTVQEVLDRFSNRVQIKGAVYRPGDFAISDKLSVKELIKKAGGLTGDANRTRAYVVRSNEDLSFSTYPFNLGDLMSGQISDIQLRREDIVRVLSIYDLKEEFYVEVDGLVNNPGVYSFTDSLTIEDLLIMAGGFREAATESRIEITRRFGDSANGDIADVILLDVNREFELSGNANQYLQPYDHVIVRKNPDFFQQQFVSVEGQVFYPGSYAIKNLGERISDLVERAGGLNQYAYLKGATLLRKTEFYEGETDLQQRISDLENLLYRLENNDSSITESEAQQLKRIQGELDMLEAAEGKNSRISSYAKRERLMEIVQRNSLNTDIKPKEAESIGIDLEAIIKNPGSESDLILEKGDVLIIPKIQETVRMRGRVLYPTTTRFKPGKSAKYYIDRAGGFDVRAKKSGTYVIYANGDVKRTKRFLFFKTYPKVETGAEIIVPAKAPRIPIRATDVIAITSGLATIALLVVQITNSSNN